MYVWCKSTAWSVFKNTRMGEFDHARQEIHTARNMTSGWQVCLRDHMSGFEINGVSVETLPDDVTVCYYVQDYGIYNDGVPYPDILRPGKPVQVLMNTTQSLVFTVFCGKQAIPGEYKIQYTIHTSLEDIPLETDLKVYAPVLPEPADSGFAHEYFLDAFTGFPCRGEGATPPVTPFYDFERYSQPWWELMKSYAGYMKLLRINVLNLRVLQLLMDGGTRRTGMQSWQFDFSVFDCFVEWFLKHGSFQKISLRGVVKQVYGKELFSIDENGKELIIDMDRNPDLAEAWIKALFTALYSHFQEKGWLHMVIAHLEDEPHSCEYWNWAREKLSAYMPGVPASEPIDSCGIGEGLKGCDIYIPRLEVFHEEQDFYFGRQGAGEHLWCYSCCFPEDPWWLNKFLDLPQRYSRILYWACYSQGFEGFLHWGFAHWSDQSEYGITPDAHYKGDGFIVYPDVENNGLILSNRGIATVEGMEEVELLRMLEKRDPEKAKEISRRIATSFRDFTEDPAVLDAARAEILKSLDT